MEQILHKIEQASDAQITEIIQAVIRRYGRVYPNDEICFLSLPRDDPQERRRILDAAVELLRKT